MFNINSKNFALWTLVSMSAVVYGATVSENKDPKNALSHDADFDSSSDVSSHSDAGDPLTNETCYLPNTPSMAFIEKSYADRITSFDCDAMQQEYAKMELQQAINEHKEKESGLNQLQRSMNSIPKKGPSLKTLTTADVNKTFEEQFESSEDEIDLEMLAVRQEIEEMKKTPRKATRTEQEKGLKTPNLNDKKEIQRRIKALRSKESAYAEASTGKANNMIARESIDISNETEDNKYDGRNVKVVISEPNVLGKNDTVHQSSLGDASIVCHEDTMSNEKIIETMKFDKALPNSTNFSNDLLRNLPHFYGTGTTPTVHQGGDVEDFPSIENGTGSVDNHVEHTSTKAAHTTRTKVSDQTGNDAELAMLRSNGMHEEVQRTKHGAENRHGKANRTLGTTNQSRSVQTSTSNKTCVKQGRLEKRHAKKKATPYTAQGKATSNLVFAFNIISFLIYVSMVWYVCKKSVLPYFKYVAYSMFVSKKASLRV